MLQWSQQKDCQKRREGQNDQKTEQVCSVVYKMADEGCWQRIRPLRNNLPTPIFFSAMPYNSAQPKRNDSCQLFMSKYFQLLYGEARRHSAAAFLLCRGCPAGRHLSLEVTPY